LNMVWLPVVSTWVEIVRGNPQVAIQSIQKASSYEFGASMPGRITNPGFAVIYARGQAYLRAGTGKEAAAEFQKILLHRGVDLGSPLYPLAHLGLARARAVAGDAAESREAYKTFFAFWKDADADIPVLKEARSEYAKLH